MIRPSVWARDGRANAIDLPDVTSGIFFREGLDTISENQKCFARRTNAADLVQENRLFTPIDGGSAFALNVRISVNGHQQQTGWKR
jgi:hypothetical protein